MTICISEAAELSSSGGANYAWSPPIGLSCVNCPNPSATPPTTTTYIIMVSSAKNCSATDTVTVFVKGECPEIYVPTGFSPNGDNNNDVLYVFGLMKDLHFVIYNRWGQIVFETSDKLIGWNGEHNGMLVQSGIYAYKFTATDPKGTIVKKSGNITVIR
jgi:gliding motility-associated-like protein